MGAHFTKRVSDELTKSLDEAGMHIQLIVNEVEEITVYNPTYAEVFDWLMYKGISVEVVFQFGRWVGSCTELSTFERFGIENTNNWESATEAAIKKALALIC